MANVDFEELDVKPNIIDTDSVPGIDSTVISGRKDKRWFWSTVKTFITTGLNIAWNQLGGGSTPFVPFEPQAVAIAHGEGRLYYDLTKHNFVALNDVIDVALDLGLEVWIRVFNDTGVTITNGQICYISGVNIGNGLQEVTLAQSNSLSTSVIIGWSTHDMEDQTIGYIVAIGDVSDLDLSAFNVNDQLFLSPTVAGAPTNVPPLPPDNIVPVGRVLSNDASVGKVFVRIGNILSPSQKVISLGFSSSGGVTGVDNFIGTHYRFAASVTPSGPGDNLGSAAEMHGSHAYIVLSGASTDMIIRVSGDSWDQQTETLADFEDIDTSGGSTDGYFETTIKWNGIVNFALLSGTPVDINIGFASYFNNSGTRFILTSINWTGVAGANDVGPDFQIREHSPIGWTFAAPGAIPPTPTIDLQSILTNGALVNGVEFAFELTGFSDVIEGDQANGLVVSINYNSNNSILTSNIGFNLLN